MVGGSGRPYLWQCNLAAACGTIGRHREDGTRKSVASRGTGLDQCSCDSCYRGNGWKTSGRKQTGDPGGTGDPVLPASGRFVSGGLHGCCTQLCV